jgi:transposase, IS5 family
MLRIYCLQQWYSLSDPGAGEALQDIQSMRAFCGLDRSCDEILDETTMLNRLLERRDLTKAIFAAMSAWMRSGLVHTAGVTTGKVHKRSSACTAYWAFPTTAFPLVWRSRG